MFTFKKLLKSEPYSEENACGEAEAPIGSLVSVDDGLTSYSCEAGYLLSVECTDLQGWGLE